MNHQNRLHRVIVARAGRSRAVRIAALGVALLAPAARAAGPELVPVHAPQGPEVITTLAAATDDDVTTLAAGAPCDTCRCDVDGSGTCDINDLLTVLNCFGSPPSAACPDLNCDGVIDGRDVGVITCFLSGGDGEQCCKGVTPKWTQLPHPNSLPPEGYNVPSNVDWQILAQQPPGQVGPGPNRVVADDFLSDGRPITCVRWWGSYVDPAFEPNPGFCSCDLDGDQDCDLADLQILVGCFGPPSPGCPFDYNCDGEINDIDAEIWQCLADGNPPDVCCGPCPAPREIDGWLISFHADGPVVVPPGFPQPQGLLGLYFARRDAMRIRPTELFGWDGHRVFEYNVELEACHLVHSYLDPRPGANPPDPARERKFLESANFRYWLDIEAVVGHTYEKINFCPTCECDFDQSGDCDINDLLFLLNCFGQPGCPDLNCDGVTDAQDVCVWECLAQGGSQAECCGDWTEVPTDNFATEDFWGWHTSPDIYGGNSVFSPLVHGPQGQWLYPDWEPVDGTPHGIEDVQQAFQLLTPLCPADLNGNFDVDFADILVAIGAWGPCVCGPCPEDIDCSGDVGFSDILRIIANWGPCL